MFNTSKYVDSKVCLICRGGCCRRYMLKFPKKLPEYELSIVERFRLLDTDKIWVEDMGDSFIVHFDFSCRELDYEGKCKIYASKDRPLICKVFPSEDDVTCPYKKI